MSEYIAIKRPLLLFLVFFGCLLTACGSTSIVSMPLPAFPSPDVRYQVAVISLKSENVPAKFKKDLRTYLEKDLSRLGLLGASDSPRRVSVNITRFRMKSVDSTMRLSLLGGKDFVVADVQVVDRRNGKVIGSTTIESSGRLSSGGGGSFTSRHAKAIARFLQDES
ncbi:MAG: hypothetical protein AB8B97_19385 [Granulosicoccus sp.]